MAKEKQAGSGASADQYIESLSLDTLVEATKNTEPDRAKDLFETLVRAVSSNVNKVDKDVVRTIESLISDIDNVVSKQLAVVMHDEKFQKLEGSWRGLKYLVQNSETGENLKLRVLNCSKKELHTDLSRAPEFTESQIFKKVYTGEFDQSGGTPFGALIGDYQFDHGGADMDCLSKMSGVAAAAFAPFITSPSPKMFGFDSWTETSNPRDLKKIFDTEEYIKWRSFRESEDSRYVVMTMPRVMARLPYGANTTPVDGFNFEEVPLGRSGEPIEIDHDEYCWMNAAYCMGANLTSAFSETGWCTAIRGVENGGKVENLPSHVVKTKKGDKRQKCPTEILIPDSREKEFSDMGFITLGNFKGTDYAVFMGAETCQKAKTYDRPEATANAKISARLPYIMAASRFSHYLKCIARDKVGSFMEAQDCEDWLDRWIKNYVCAQSRPSSEEKAKFPLSEARVEVKEVPGSPGVYNARFFLKPFLQMEELNAAMSMVAQLPSGKK